MNHKRTATARGLPRLLSNSGTNGGGTDFVQSGERMVVWHVFAATHKLFVKVVGIFYGTIDWGERQMSAKAQNRSRERSHRYILQV